MKKLISILMVSIIAVSCCIPIFANGSLDQKQQEVNNFIEEINAQYGTYFVLTISESTSMEELETFKQFVVEQAKEQKQIREEIKSFELNSRTGGKRINPGPSITKNVSTTTTSKVSNGSSKMTLTFRIGARATYDDFGFSKVTAIYSDPITTGLDWKQNSGRGHIFGDDLYLNISAEGDYHYLRNGIRLDGYNHTISAPIDLSDVR